MGDMVYGIMTEKDVKLSSVARALGEKTTPKKSRKGSVGYSREAGLHDVIAADNASLSFGIHAVPEFHFNATALGSI